MDKGTIVALVGTNGAGKSTILKGISNIILLSAGDILFNGKSIGGMRPEKITALGISHVPEGRRLFSRLTVLENLELGAYPSNSRPFLKESLGRVFDLFPLLRDRVACPAGTLSGGEQQMLAIGRALMARPSLLMLDEPSLGLAPILARLLFEIIEALKKESVTILLVEQNVHHTLEISDYVYVLQSGSLKMEGQTKELIKDSEFQQTFLGMTG
jgi:branched-chain amino acid transport system ATP-binding protein